MPAVTLRQPGGVRRLLRLAANSSRGRPKMLQLQRGRESALLPSALLCKRNELQKPLSVSSNAK
jgi:hypothetical protein